MEAFAQFIPLILIFAIMYFLLIRPQQKKVKEHQAMVAALRRGDEIVTQGGLIGKITKVKDDNEVEVELSQGVKVRVVRPTIAQVRPRRNRRTTDPFRLTPRGPRAMLQIPLEPDPDRPRRAGRSGLRDAEPVLPAGGAAQRRRRRDRGDGRHLDANAAALAGWPEFLPSTLVNLGLDLRGGAHLLAEVAVEDVYEARMDSLWPEVRDALRDLRDTVGTIRRIDAPPGELHVRVSQPEGLAGGRGRVRALARRSSA
jgi:preprotein translocase subunit YajC